MIIKLEKLIDPAKAGDMVSAILADAGEGKPVIRSETSHKLGAELRGEIAADETFSAASMVKDLGDFEFRCIEENNGYEMPFDNPLVENAGRPPVRADLWVTVFLNPPGDYEGGELVVHSGTLTERIKLEQGDAVIYPASNFQNVLKVSKGARWTADAAIQSVIRDDDERQVLHEVHSVLNWMNTLPPQGQQKLATANKALRRARANMFRLWVDS